VKHNNTIKAISIIAVLMMTMTALAVPTSSGDSVSETPSFWTYKITIGGNTEDTPVYIESVTDGNGNPTENLTSSSVGSWGWDENFEYGPFGSYYAAFNSQGNMICHLYADNLVESIEDDEDGYAYDVSDCNIMWVLPTIYWSTDDNGNLILSNDPSKGEAYAHTIDGKVYPYLAIGVFETYVDNGVAKSLMKKVPTRSTSLQKFREYSEYTINTDNGHTSNGQSMQWNYFQWSLYKYCVFATLGTFDSQSFGMGVVNDSDSIMTGRTCRSIPFESGYFTLADEDTEGKESVRLFLENSWGSLSEYVDNVFVENRNWYVGQTSRATTDKTNKINIGQMDTSALGYIQTIKTSASNWGLPASSVDSEIAGTTGLYDYYFSNYDDSFIVVGGYYYGGLINGVSKVASSIIMYDHAGGSITSRLSFVFDTDPIKERHIVSYDPNDGETAPTDVKVEYGMTTILPTPSRQHWNFVGWYEGDTKIGMGGAPIMVTTDRTLVAHWVEQMVDLVLHYNLPDSDNEIYKRISLNINTSPASIMPDDPIHDNLTFMGWYNEPNSVSLFNPNAIMYESRDAYAKWIKTPNLTSQPIVDHISENTYSMSIELSDGQTAAWFDSDDRQIGTGATIEHTFEGSGNHIGYVRIYNTSDGSLYAEKEWSTENSTEEETKGYKVNIPLAVAATILIAMAGFFLVRRI